MHSVLGQRKQWQKQYIAIGKTDLFYNSMGLWGNFTTSTFKRLTYKFENLTKAGKTNLNKNPSEHYVYLIMLITSYTNYFELVMQHVCMKTSEGENEPGRVKRSPNNGNT